MRFRSPHELAFRIRQEVANLWLYFRRPAFGSGTFLEKLPAPGPIVEKLRGTQFESEILEIASQVLRHEIPVMGRTLSVGSEIHWRWDYSHAAGPGALGYFRNIPYLDPEKVGDYRLIWEFNRHQYLVAVMQAFLFSGDSTYADEVWRQMESWWEHNPFTEGINWTSALEVAFRALSWIWIYHFGREFMPEDFRARFLIEIYRHARFLEHNLSVYFSPNTHLQGEAVALHAIGTLFPDFPGAVRWRRLGARIVARQMEVQVRDDGGHFENATFYQLYALDFFLFHLLLADTTPNYRVKLEKMADYTAALSGSRGVNPFIGDDDGGRVFHPFGNRSEFGRASLATCGVLFNRPEWIASSYESSKQAAWWLGVRALAPRSTTPASPRSRLFAQTGTAVLESGGTHVVMDNGPFGWGSGGHSHCDTLSLTISNAAEEVLIDPGTYTYVLSPWRDRFRATASHNTVRIDGRDQAIPRKAFSWYEKPECEILAHRFEADLDFLLAECRYAGLIHRRRVLFCKRSDLLCILDEVETAQPDGGAVHVAEQFWHPGVEVVPESSHLFRLGLTSRLLLMEGTQPELSQAGEFGWRSRCLTQKESAPLIRATVKGSAPLYLAAVFSPQSSAETTPAQMSVKVEAGRVSCRIMDMAQTVLSEVRFDPGRAKSFQILQMAELARERDA